ncbi:MAG: hypothetical protein WAM14_27030 [Candidatus Nitrosopolaris sp.]
MTNTESSSLSPSSLSSLADSPSLLTACRIMHENDIGSVIIVKNDDKNNTKPIGISQREMLYDC